MGVSLHMKLRASVDRADFTPRSEIWCCSPSCLIWVNTHSLSCFSRSHSRWGGLSSEAETWIRSSRKGCIVATLKQRLLCLSGFKIKVFGLFLLLVRLKKTLSFTQRNEAGNAMVSVHPPFDVLLRISLYTFQVFCENIRIGVAPILPHSRFSFHLEVILKWWHFRQKQFRDGRLKSPQIGFKPGVSNLATWWSVIDVGSQQEARTQHELWWHMAICFFMSDPRGPVNSSLRRQATIESNW